MRERKIDPGRLYGYTVCLVAAFVSLFALVRLTHGILDIRELEYTPTYHDSGPSLVSLGAYKLDVLGRGGLGGAGGGEDAASATVAAVSTTSGFARMYEAERLYRLALAHQASRTRIVVSLVLLMGALFLFGSHAVWLGRLSVSEEAGGR